MRTRLCALYPRRLFFIRIAFVFFPRRTTLGILRVLASMTTCVLSFQLKEEEKNKREETCHNDVKCDDKWIKSTRRALINGRWLVYKAYTCSNTLQDIRSWKDKQRCGGNSNSRAPQHHNTCLYVKFKCYRRLWRFYNIMTFLLNKVVALSFIIMNVFDLKPYDKDLKSASVIHTSLLNYTCIPWNWRRRWDYFRSSS